MVFYAQIDENKVCMAVSQLAEEVEAPNLIRIDKMYYDLLGSVYEIGHFFKTVEDANGIVTARFDFSTRKFDENWIPE